MVELGRALADGPRVLLLDEPTSGLGEAELAKLGQQVTWLHESGTCAILLIEHDISFVMEHSDRIVALDAGRVLAVGSPDEIRGNTTVRDAVLGLTAPTRWRTPGHGEEGDLGQNS